MCKYQLLLHAGAHSYHIIKEVLCYHVCYFFQVDAVVTFAAGLKPVLKHFQMSGKSSFILNDALLIMEMKSLKAITWCPTRMANILTASKRTVEILFPLSDVLTSANIKPDETAYFLSLTCLTLLHLMADLEPLFVGR